MIAKRNDKIVLAGGSGYLGSVLARWFRNAGQDVVVLSRSGDSSHRVRNAIWDGRTLGPWCEELEGAAAVINLAGRSVNCRYHARNREQIIRSRIESTKILGEAIARCELPPAAWLNTSTATIYRHSYDRPQDEIDGTIGSTPEAKDAFSVEVAKEWEKTFFSCEVPNTRQVALRLAMVMGNDSRSVYAVLRRLTCWGLGGKMGDGRQYMSWIHETDYCRAAEWLISRDDISGVVNLAASTPLTNRDLLHIMRQQCGRPIGLPATRWMLEVGAVLLRTETELIIKSRRVVPRRLHENGFRFLFNNFAQAAADLEASLRRGKHLRRRAQLVLP